MYTIRLAIVRSVLDFILCVFSLTNLFSSIHLTMRYDVTTLPNSPKLIHSLSENTPKVLTNHKIEKKRTTTIKVGILISFGKQNSLLLSCCNILIEKCYRFFQLAPTNWRFPLCTGPLRIGGQVSWLDHAETVYNLHIPVLAMFRLDIVRLWNSFINFILVYRVL